MVSPKRNIAFLKKDLNLDEIEFLPLPKKSGYSFVHQKLAEIFLQNPALIPQSWKKLISPDDFIVFFKNGDRRHQEAILLRFNIVLDKWDFFTPKDYRELKRTLHGINYVIATIKINKRK